MNRQVSLVACTLHTMNFVRSLSSLEFRHVQDHVQDHGQRQARGRARGRARGARGFTLVELMVVVAIVGVLATIAVVSYRKIVASSRVAEATGMLQGIRVAQESYRAEAQTYLDVSPSLDTTYPQQTPGGFKTGWGAACGAQCQSGIEWTMLPIHVDGPVSFGYAVKAGAAGTVPTQFTFNGNNQMPTSAATVDWFVAAAKGDFDQNGTFCRAYTTSFSNEIMVENDGE